jgi:16S rRNA processing protein RimM
MAVVGRIVRSHGLRGQVVVDPETDFPESRYRVGEELFGQVKGTTVRWVIAGVRFHRQRPIVALAGVEGVDAADALSGVELRVPIERLAALPEGSFYRHDLVGCRVETVDASPVGVVTAVEGDAQGSRLVIDTPTGPALVPMVAAICTDIDVAAKRIVIDPPDGLLDLNRPG